MAKKKTTTTTTSKPPRLSRASSWFDDLIGARDDEWGDHREAIWAPTRRGSRGLTDFLGGRAYTWQPPAASADVWAYTQALRFAANFARIVAGPKLRRTDWIRDQHNVHGDAIPYARLDTGEIALAAKPVAEALAGRIDREQAHTVVAGVAIHEAAHLRATPLNWLSGFLEAHCPVDPDPYLRDGDGYLIYDDDGNPRRKPPAPGRPFPEGVARAAMALVEDAFVETVALATYPGYTGYLDECWRFVRPEGTIAGHLAKAPIEDDQAAAHLLEVIQDRSRRYTPPGEEYEQYYGKLPADMRAYVAEAEAILRRAHDHRLTVEARWGLAADLATLLAKGQPPEREEERPPGPTKAEDFDGPSRPGGDGPAIWKPTPEQLATLERKAVTLITIEGLLDGEGRAATDQQLAEGIAKDVADALERDMQRETIKLRGPDGTRDVAVTWLDLEPDPEEYRHAAAAVAPLVAPLARRLAFRAERPERLVGAQLRGRLEDRRLADIPAALADGRRPRAFARREALAAPEIALPLLVDLSGSMGSYRSKLAREACALFHAALAPLRRDTRGGVDFSIHGHTSRHDEAGDGPIVYRILDERHPRPDRIGDIRARGNNYDGPALAAVAGYAARRWPDRRRVLLYLNDGQPAGRGYGGDPAMDEIAAHRRWLRARDTDILTIFLGTDCARDDLERMYGPEGLGFIVCEEVADLPDALGRALRKLLKWHA